MVKKNFLAAAILMVIWGAFMVYAQAEELKRPNILFITIDALRKDHLGCYGYQKNTSANIDRLAKEGILFTQAISQSSYTWASMLSIISSMYPSTHHAYFWDQSLPERVISFPELLSKENYFTILFTNRGDFEDLRKEFDGVVNIGNTDAKEVTFQVIQWLRNRDKNKNFFSWVHYMDVHNVGSEIPTAEHDGKNLPTYKKNTYIARYDESLIYIDRQFGILKKELARLGLDKDTLIVVASEHGEEMCEHGACFYHGTNLWDSLINVPLIMAYPGLLPPGKVVTGQVEMIDLAPTICDILKINKPNYFEGESMLALIKGKRRARPFVFSELSQNKSGDFDSKEGKDKAIWFIACIRTDEWKLIYNHFLPKDEYPEFQLFNLKDDPQELKNCAQAEKEVLSELKKELVGWQRRPKPNIESVSKPLGKELIKELKSLGYLQ